MQVPAAYIGVILIWSTTPLAIKWSSEGAGFLFGATSRMVLGAVVCLLLVRLLGRTIPWDPAARRTYLAGTLGVYGAMLTVYWSSQFIPSGLISVLFGLTPLLTGLLAAWILHEYTLTPVRMVGIGFGIAGLAWIFGADLGLGPEAAWGIGGVLVSTLLHSTSTVLVKQAGADLPALSVNGGALGIGALLYVATWLVIDGAAWPAAVPLRASASIVYLGIVGSVIGFSLYFFALRRLPATHMGMVPLVTPVLALLLGNTLNDEPIAAAVWLGTALISTGLVLYQWGPGLLRRLTRAGT